METEDFKNNFRASIFIVSDMLNSGKIDLDIIKKGISEVNSKRDLTYVINSPAINEEIKTMCENRLLEL